MRRVTKALCLTMAVFVLLCSIVLPALAAEVSVVPSFQTVSNGEHFTVDIYVDPEGNATGGAAYVLYFNNTLLSATSLVSGTFFSGYSVNTYGEGINNSTGTIDYCESIQGSGGVTTTGTLTTITFQAIADYGTSELRFDKTWTELSDPDGYPITTNTSDGSVKVGVCGDATGDGLVTMADGRRVYMHLIYGTALGCDPWGADVTGDGLITMADGRRIYMHKIYGTPLNCKVCTG